MDTQWQNSFAASSPTSVPVGSNSDGLACVVLFMDSNSAGALILAGEHDIDSKWMEEVRSECAGKCPLIGPRIVWEANGLSQRVGAVRG